MIILRVAPRLEVVLERTPEYLVSIQGVQITGGRVEEPATSLTVQIVRLYSYIAFNLSKLPA